MLLSRASDWLGVFGGTLNTPNHMPVRQATAITIRAFAGLSNRLQAHGVPLECPYDAVGGAQGHLSASHPLSVRLAAWRTGQRAPDQSVGAPFPTTAATAPGEPYSPSTHSRNSVMLSPGRRYSVNGSGPAP